MPSKPKGKAKSTGPAAPAPVLPEPALVGHEAVLDQFRHVMKRGRLGHAYLFAGPEGIGKKRVARYLAQSLLCETRDPTLLDPCGECAACAQVNAGTHPDLMLVGRPADRNELPIAVIQELVTQLSLRPARGRSKIGIVDDADALNEESANCFLKTLEEPPPGSVLILIATSVETQLATIQSRCQLVRFRPLSEDAVVHLLHELAVPLEGRDAQELAGASEGSIGQAIELAQPVWRQIEAEIQSALLKSPLKSTELAEALLAFIDDAGKESAAKRTRARKVIRLVANLLRDALRTSCLCQTPRSSALAAWAKQRGADVLGDLLDRTLDADYHVARMAGLPVTIEAWIDDLRRIADGKYVSRIA